MVSQHAVTIKAVRASGGGITWNYDSPAQCREFWRSLIETGEAPDSGEKLASACYFKSDSIEPKHRWERTATGHVEEFYPNM